ncbi:hypothetical protein [Streptomyces sp. NPDC003077]|uniref:hypothetical protein n=1 Tax=Streptomyces sp. NPDC003077 TaxID=3154443 RepID=UPI0033A2E235
MPRLGALDAASRFRDQYEMRPATRADEELVLELITARLKELDLRGHELALDRASVVDNVGTSEEARDRPVVWLLLNGLDLVGCMALRTSTPDWGWSLRERQDKALTISGLFTHPAYRWERLSRYMVWWAVDHAWHRDDTDGPLWWVRGSTPSARVAEYAREHMGVTVMNAARDAPHAFLMQRRPQALPGLARWFAPAERPGLPARPRKGWDLT